MSSTEKARSQRSQPKKTAAKQFIYFEPTGFRDGIAHTLKFRLSADNKKLEHAVTYVSESTGKCSCDGNTYRHRCKHVDMVTANRPGTPVSLAQARREISRLGQWLHTYYIFIDLPKDEPYDLEDGMVVCAHIKATGVDKRIECPFPLDGTWRIYMPDSDLKVLVRVVELRGFRNAAPPPYYRGKPQ